MSINTESLSAHKTRIVFLAIIALVAIAAGILFFYEYSERSRAVIDYFPLRFQTEAIRLAKDGGTGSGKLFGQSPSPNHPISFVRMTVTYPKSIVDFDGVSDSECAEMTTVVVDESMQGNLGVLRITRNTVGPRAELPIDLFCIAALKFKAKGVIGTGKVEFFQTNPNDENNWEIISPSTSFSPRFETPNFIDIIVTEDGTGGGTPGGGTGGPTPTTDPTATGSARLNVRVKLQGIVARPRRPQPLDMQVTLVKGAQDEQTVIGTKTARFTVQDNGDWVTDTGFDATPAGDYAIFIKGPKHLQKKICDNTPSENLSGTYACDEPKISLRQGNQTLDFTGVLLLTGDIPVQNGLIDSYDISFVRNNLGTTGEDRLDRADLNLDGIVDTQDYSLIIAALEFKYEDDIQPEE
ncbi:MAG: dockerin type I domain-containing protein [Weeksellaceae bacterium]